MEHNRILFWLQWVGWVFIIGLSMIVALLWARIDRQVVQNKADIAAIKAYSDAKDAKMHEEAAAEQARLERRWGQFLMPTLRQHHDAIQSMPLAPEYVQPMPDWLKEKP